VFIFTTMLTVALATKKLVSFAGLGAKKRNLERLEREIKGMEEEAGVWLSELVRTRSGGEEPPAEETRGAVLAGEQGGGSLRLQLDQALLREEALRAEAATVVARAERAEQEISVLRKRVR
jgi:hypothetical protein